MRRAFSLVELLVVMAIGATMMAVSFPVLTFAVRTTQVQMGAQRTVAALQYNVMLVGKMNKPDFDGAEPRVPGATFTGTALVFDEARHKAWFTINHQAAVFDSTAPAGVANTVEWQADPDQAGVSRKAYVRLQGTDIEHMDLQDSLAYFGIAWDSAAGTFRLVPTPFAVCARPGGGGIPHRNYLDVDLMVTNPANNQLAHTAATGFPRGGFDNPDYALSPSGQRRVPTALPWVIVVSRNAATQGWTTDWDRQTTWNAFRNQIPNLTGAGDDSGRIQALLQLARGELVQVSINGGTSLD